MNVGHSVEIACAALGIPYTNLGVEEQARTYANLHYGCHTPGKNVFGVELLGSSLSAWELLPPSQIITRFSFSKYIVFDMHLDIRYGMLRCIAKSINIKAIKMTKSLGWREYISGDFFSFCQLTFLPIES